MSYRRACLSWALALCCSLPLGGLQAAEEVGRKLNFNTPGSPTYVEPVLAKEDQYTLPDIPSISSSSASVNQLSNSPTIMVREIVVRDCTVLSASELGEITQSFTNKVLGVEDLQTLRLLLSQAYLKKGFVNSGVVIPDQKVEDGVIYFRAIEGSLSGLEIEGDTRLRYGYIEGRLQRKIGQPLNVNEIQDALRYLRRDPMIDRLDARLAPGSRLGEGIIKLAVAEPKRFEVGVTADNHRSSSVGAERGRLSLKAQNLTGFGETIRLSGSVSEGSDDADAAFSLPLNKWNTSFQAYYSTSDSEIVEDAFEVLDIESQTDTWGGILTHPIIDNLSNTLSVSLGFENKHSESTLGGVPFSLTPGAVEGESETNVGLLGLDWVNRGDDHVLGFRATWRRGLDIGDATIFNGDTLLARLANPTQADAEFDVSLFQALYIKRLNTLWGFTGLNDRAQLVLRSTAQIAFDPLLSLEKIAIGGVNTVRGYQENLLVRDNGVSATIELQFPIFGYRADPHPANLLIAPFVDFGMSWDKEDTDVTSDIRDTSEKRSIWGAGIGLIWQPIKNLRAQVYWGEDFADNFDGDDPRDLNTRDPDLQDDGVHVALSYFTQF